MLDDPGRADARPEDVLIGGNVPRRADPRHRREEAVVGEREVAASQSHKVSLDRVRNPEKGGSQPDSRKKENALLGRIVQLEAAAHPHHPTGRPVGPHRNDRVAHGGEEVPRAAVRDVVRRGRDEVLRGGGEVGGEVDADEVKARDDGL